MALGASAPLVVTFILVQRVGRRKVAVQARRLMTNLSPHVERVANERDRWRSELAIGELIEWALQAPALNPRPKR